MITKAGLSRESPEWRSRMKLFNWMKHYVPKYAVLPLLGCLALNMLVYYGSRLFNLSMTSYDLSLPLDHRIPLVPPFIVVYMLSLYTGGSPTWSLPPTARSAAACCLAR